KDDLVVAPYASMLALSIEPAGATDNLRRLAELGLVGPMGLYEAIDFTRQSKRGGQRGVVIYAYIAHPQGMTLLALDNLLRPQVIQRRFHCNFPAPPVQSLP